MVNRLQETQEIADWDEEAAASFIEADFQDTFGVNLEEFSAEFGISLKNFIQLTLSSKVMTPELKKQLMAMPASELCELPALLMETPLPWTPLMQETMVAALDILPALTLKYCNNVPKPSVYTFKEKAIDLSEQMLRPFMLERHSTIYSSGKESVKDAKYEALLSAQEELVKNTAAMSWKALVADAVNAMADAFFPLISDPRIALGVAPLLYKPVIELLVRDRLPLTIELTLRLLRIGLKVVGAQGKIFVPTYCSTGETRDWYKVYVSFSGNVSARTVLGKTSWYLSTTLAVGAIVGQAVVAVAAPPVAAVAGTVIASQANKATQMAMTMTSSITKWFGQETLSPYSFKWDPSEPLMAVEGHIRYYLSNWSKENEIPAAWIGTNTGMAFFSLIAPFATVSSLTKMEPEGLASLDALMHSPGARAEITRKLTAMYKVMNSLVDKPARRHIVHEQFVKHTTVGKVGVASQVNEAYGIAVHEPELWDPESTQAQMSKYVWENIGEVDGVDDIKLFINGAIQRLPDNQLTDLFENSDDFGAALEALCQDIAEKIAASFFDYAEYALDLATWIVGASVDWI